MTIASLLFAFIALPVGGDRTGPAEPVLLDFTATWCGPCRSMKPVVDQLVQKGYPVKKVDLDQSPDVAAKYKVSEVPTFIVVDPTTGRQLARTTGAQPASELAQLYLQAKIKYHESLADSDRERQDDAPPAGEADADDAGRPAVPAAPDERRPKPDKPNPDPWQTVVRIKVHGRGSIGFGSGTLVYSSPGESIILTCAHIFKLDGARQAHPSKFPRRITVDLFDGRLVGQKPAQVHYQGETFEGEAIDYDFGRDVGLLRIRPGRRLPYAKVVPPYWSPQSGMGVITVGCPEGQDATAWNTVIQNPQMKGLSGNPQYEAIECAVAPKQGRSGGGLFTSNGYVAGVCDFAEPRGNHGLYATPRSIYSILDRNNLVALYDPSKAPAQSGRLLAENGRTPRRTLPADVTRGQSPEPDLDGSLTIPPPELLGIKTPALADAGENENDGGTVTRRTGVKNRQSWHVTTPSGVTATDQTLDRSLDPDHFDAGGSVPTPARSANVEPETSPSSETGPIAAPAETPETPAPVRVRTRKAVGSWHAGRAALPALTTGAVN